MKDQLREIADRLEVPEMTGDQEGFDVFMEAVRKAAPVPIRFDEVPEESKGYYDNGKNKTYQKLHILKKRYWHIYRIPKQLFTLSFMLV